MDEDLSDKIISKLIDAGYNDGTHPVVEEVIEMLREGLVDEDERCEWWRYA